MKFTSSVPPIILRDLAYHQSTIYSASRRTSWSGDKLHHNSGMVVNTLYTEMISWMQLDNAKVWFYATTAGTIYANRTRPTAETASSTVNVATLMTY